MFIGSIIKVTPITSWNVELAFQGALNRTMNKKDACLKTQERKTYSDFVPNFLASPLFFHIYLRFTLSSSKRNPVGIRLEQLNVFIKSVTFGIGRSEFCHQLIHPLELSDLGRELFT